MFNQRIIPAISNYKDLEVFIKTTLEYCIILNFHLNHLDDIVSKLQKHKKKVLVHIDLINGLCNDKYGAEYLCQRLKVEGIISTKPAALLVAKNHKCLAIQRIFLIDSTSLKKSIDLVLRVNPDILEVLPGIATSGINKINELIDIPIIGGGLITSIEDVEKALSNGLMTITTGEKKLWSLK